MSINLTSNQKEIIRKCIYAVETGGQVYGGVKYDSYVGKNTNTSNEIACTIGGGANYGETARTLMKMILEKYPAVFRANDTAGIEDDLASSWRVYDPGVGSEKARCIQKIISTQQGIKCQDELLDSQMLERCEKALKLGVTNLDAQVFCANIEHLGGYTALKRVLGKCNGNYTLDNIYAVLKTDQQDTSSNNQVGDTRYWSRHQKIYGWIKEKLSVSTTTNEVVTITDVNTVISTATNEINYLEKKSNSNLDDKTTNAGSSNFTKYWRDINPSFQGQAWCLCFIVWVFEQSYGQDTAKKLLCMDNGYTFYTPTAATYFKNKSQWYTTPQVGDVIFFENSTRICHVGLVYKVDANTVYTIEGNTSSGNNQVVANGGGVFKKSYTLTNSRISGYGRPQYSNTSVTTTLPSSSVISKGKITASKLNIRTGAGTNYPTCAFSPLAKDTEIGICGTVSDWYYIEYNGSYGYVSAKYVEKTEDIVATTSTESAKSYLASIKGKYVTTAKLNMRIGAGTDKSIICTIPCGDAVSCYGYYTDLNGIMWYYVSYKAYTGFVSSQYLTKGQE